MSNRIHKIHEATFWGLDADGQRVTPAWDKPSRFTQADKDAFATLYAPVTRIVLATHMTSNHRFGGSFSSHTRFQYYEQNVQGKWVVVETGQYTQR